MDSNHRPRAYQARALTTWAMSPCKFLRCISSFSHPYFWLPFLVVTAIAHFPSRGLVRFQRYYLEACLSGLPDWWRWWESNPWPPACRAGALPAELHPHFFFGVIELSFRSLKIEQQWKKHSARAVLSRLSLVLVYFQTTTDQSLCDHPLRSP